LFDLDFPSKSGVIRGSNQGRACEQRRLALASPAMGGAHDQSAVLSAVAPCDSCKFRERCARERLACARFVSFYCGAAERQWRQAPCAPDRATWLSIFERGRGRPRSAAGSAASESPHQQRRVASSGLL
jgi:hypothetical protein